VKKEKAAAVAKAKAAQKATDAAAAADTVRQAIGVEHTSSTVSRVLFSAKSSTTLDLMRRAPLFSPASSISFPTLQNMRPSREPRRPLLPLKSTDIPGEDISVLNDRMRDKFHFLDSADRLNAASDLLVTLSRKYISASNEEFRVWAITYNRHVKDFVEKGKVDEDSKSHLGLKINDLVQIEGNDLLWLLIQRENILTAVECLRCGYFIVVVDVCRTSNQMVKLGLFDLRKKMSTLVKQALRQQGKEERVSIGLYRPYQVYARLYWSGSLEVFTRLANDISFVYRWVSEEANINASDTKNMADTDQVVTLDETLLEEEEKSFS